MSCAISSLLCVSSRPARSVCARLNTLNARNTRHLRTSAGVTSARTRQSLATNHVCAANPRTMSVNASGESYDYDLFCIGAGSGGTRAARMAAANYGAKVAIAEMPYDPIASDEKGGAGGTCVLRGCVPKKLFVYCSEYSEAFRDAEGFGWDIPGKPTLNWGTFMEKKNEELKRLNGVYMRLLEGAGVDVHMGRGTIVDAHTVAVNGKTFTAKNILVATGGKAFKPDIAGAEHAIISDHALEINEVPESVAVIGGGYIGVEFAGIFANLGSRTHLVFRQPLPLRGFDEEVRVFAAEQYALSGVDIRASRNPKSIVKLPNGKLQLTLGCANNSEQDEVIEVDHVMMATGRKPNVANLGLEEAGVELDSRGAIKVDEYSRTTCPSIWAVGDVTGRMELTPVALMESMALLQTLFNDNPTKPDHTNIATAVFSHPQIGTVGMSEEKAVAEFKNVDVYTSSFRPMRNTISGSPGRTFMKLIVAADTLKVIGVHMVGPDSAEIMQGMGVAVKMGVTKTQLDSVVGIHPSSAEEFVTMRTPTRTIRDGKVV